MALVTKESQSISVIYLVVLGKIWNDNLLKIMCDSGHSTSFFRQ
jgi:hypothetical protein